MGIDTTYRKFGSTTLCRFNNGMWDVTSMMYDAKSEDGEKWDEISLEARGVDADIDVANSLALTALLDEFDRRVIRRGLTSLFEARDLDSKLKEDEAKATGN